MSYRTSPRPPLNETLEKVLNANKEAIEFRALVDKKEYRVKWKGTENGESMTDSFGMADSIGPIHIFRSTAHIQSH